MISHKTSLNEFKKTESISHFFFNHKDMRLEINCKKKLKNASTWILNNMLLNNQWVIEEIKEEITKYLKTIKMETQ